MESLKPILASAGAIVLLAGLAAGAAAQEASPDPSPEPSPAVSPEPLEVEATTAPLPVADYWGQWSLHKRAFHDRLRFATRNAVRAKSKKVGFPRSVVGVHDDELLWLDRHPPEDCYTAEYERWREAVEDLRAIDKKAVGLVRKSDARGLKRVAKQRRAATRDLDKLLSNVSDCVDSVSPTVTGDPFVGRWISHPGRSRWAGPVVVGPKAGFIDRSPRHLTISDSGRMLMRIPRFQYCREWGHGLVPFVLKAQGETVIDGTPAFQWSDGSVACQRKGKAPAVIARDLSGAWGYDPATDVLLAEENCYWRKRGGSSEDCEAFWRGTPAPAEDVEAPVEEAATSDEEVTASPDVDEG